MDIDTGIVPYASGARFISGGQGVGVNQGVHDNLPRTWQPLMVQGDEKGRAVVIYQTGSGGIEVADVIGGTNGGRYEVITTD